MKQLYYHGQGKRCSTPLELPIIDHDSQTEPQGYLATPELAAAVDTAITLGMPLLLTGEPGSGKSALAKSIAWEVLGENEKPLTYIVKSDTRAIDLFYHFDSVARFQAANINQDISPHLFVTFNAMGRAILQAKEINEVKKILKEKAGEVHSGTPKRSVVLIDEIDKAHRDVPNDILVEIEQVSFNIQELNTTVSLEKSEQKFQPIIIITSNSEKALPEPFLRRCVFHHLQFPPFSNNENDSGITVNDIVAIRLGNRYKKTQSPIDKAINWFKYLREEAYGIERKPSLAELLNWIEYLIKDFGKKDIDVASQKFYSSTLSLLLKNPNDQKKCKGWLKKWGTTD